MSIRASISYSKRHHLYFEELLSAEPKCVFLELTSPREFTVTKETFQHKTIENVVVAIPSDEMDQIAIAWIKKRRLEETVAGPAKSE